VHDIGDHARTYAWPVPDDRAPFTRRVGRTLRREGVDVWGVPRAGFVAGLNVGTRRRMGENLWLRADLLWQYRQLFLFATDQTISGLRFRKNWSADGMTLGLNLGVELGL